MLFLYDDDPVPSVLADVIDSKYTKEAELMKAAGYSPSCIAVDTRFISDDTVVLCVDVALTAVRAIAARIRVFMDTAEVARHSQNTELARNAEYFLSTGQELMQQDVLQCQLYLHDWWQLMCSRTLQAEASGARGAAALGTAS